MHVQIQFMETYDTIGAVLISSFQPRYTYLHRQLRSAALPRRRGAGVERVGGHGHRRELGGRGRQCARASLGVRLGRCGRDRARASHNRRRRRPYDARHRAGGGRRGGCCDRVRGRHSRRHGHRRRGRSGRCSGRRGRVGDRVGILTLVVVARRRCGGDSDGGGVERVRRLVRCDRHRSGIACTCSLRHVRYRASKIVRRYPLSAPTPAQAASVMARRVASLVDTMMRSRSGLRGMERGERSRSER